MLRTREAVTDADGLQAAFFVMLPLLIFAGRWAHTASVLGARGPAVHRWFGVVEYGDGFLDVHDRMQHGIRMMQDVGFLRPQHRELLIAGDELDDLLSRMAAHQPAKPITSMRAEEL